MLASSPLRSRYDQPVDRESAHERLTQRAAERQPEPAPAPRGRAAPAAPTVGGEAAAAIGKMAQSALRAAGTQLGREVMRGLLGGLFGGGRRRTVAEGRRPGRANQGAAGGGAACPSPR